MTNYEFEYLDESKKNTLKCARCVGHGSTSSKLTEGYQNYNESSVTID